MGDPIMSLMAKGIKKKSKKVPAPTRSTEAVQQARANAIAGRLAGGRSSTIATSSQGLLGDETIGRQNLLGA